LPVAIDKAVLLPRDERNVESYEGDEERLREKADSRAGAEVV
jgi:hypothetical protein